LSGFGLWFAKILSFFVSLIPRPLILLFGRFLGFLWWDVLRLRRFTIYRNLSIVFPDLSKQQKSEIARESLNRMGVNFLDFLRIPSLGPGYLRRHAIFEGLENYEEVRRRGKGVFMMSLHIGNGDFGVALMALAGIPVNLISKKFKQKWINDFWFGVREMRGTKFFDPHGKRTAFDILKATSQNQVVVFVLDQFMGKPFGIESTFFGRKTGTAYGLALFSLKSGVPVVPAYTYWDAQGKVHVVFEPPIEPVPGDDRDLQIKEMTEQYNRVLEKIILRHPEQWMWVHRRWKKWE
jgi:KDO2-lipid IV(A) lauroyltransferase